MTYRNSAYYQSFNCNRISFKYGELKRRCVHLLNIQRGVNNSSKHTSWRSFFIIEREALEKQGLI